MSTAPLTSHGTEFPDQQFESRGIMPQMTVLKDLHSIIQYMESGVAHVESKSEGNTCIWVIEGPEKNPVVVVHYRMKSSLLINEGVRDAITNDDNDDDDGCKPNDLTWTAAAPLSPNDASSNCEVEERNVSSNFEQNFELKFQAASASTSLRQTDKNIGSRGNGPALKSLTTTDLPYNVSLSTHTDHKLQLSFFNAADELFVVKREIPESELVPCHQILPHQNDLFDEIVQENEKYNQLSSNITAIEEDHAIKLEASDNIISCSNLAPNIGMDSQLTSSYSSKISEDKEVCSMDPCRPTCTEDPKLYVGESSHQCSFCANTFNSKKHRMAHEKMHIERRYLCSYCGKTFSQSCHQKRHERSHTGEKRHQCSFCDKKFSQLTYRKVHERIHTGEKPHQCSFCDKKFSMLANQLSHERTHTGEKPHACSFCNRRFTRSTHKKRHEQTHTGEKPHQCCFCDKKFSVLAYKKRHERTHTGE